MVFALQAWYLRSLRFLIASKYLGPKLYMLKDMFRDLFAFIYLIFTAVVAYGVVSRSLVLHKEIPLNGLSLLGQIFDPSYWVIFADIRDKDMIEKLMQNTTSTKRIEATVTHVLLGFYMLFINILLLNLLIAVFADTIGKVQQNSDFYWRHQRYAFVQDYFQQPFLAYPPLIILSYLTIICSPYRKIKNKCTTQPDPNNSNTTSEETTCFVPLFKIIPNCNESFDERLDMFEDSATLIYARSTIEKNKLSSSINQNRSLFGEIFDEQRKISNKSNSLLNKNNESQSSNLDRENIIDYFKNELPNIQSKLDHLQIQLHRRISLMENSQTKSDQTTELTKETTNSIAE